MPVLQHLRGGSEQPPCARPPHRSRWLDAIALLLHCGLSGEAAEQCFKAKTPVTWPYRALVLNPKP